ncbi:M20 family metallopeptidase [Paenisporosarcina sp.]|uniref:M20 family metallopeptidase n=1 Tax=Paenisporosarcina sp. TaxID=1932001 RepID=UPI003C73EDF5
MTDRYSFLKKHEEDIRTDLISIVQAESPTLQKELVDITGNLLKEMMLNRLGNDYICTVHSQPEYGDHLLFEKNYPSKPRILFLSHFDTVWQKGELPIRFEDQKMYGPGVFDMKAGLLSSIWAVASLEKTMDALPISPVFLFTSDEETGSMSSRELIEQVAETCEAVFVMEPAEAHSNALKTARKGVGIYNIEVEGISAHAGNHHEDGVNAILEIAYLVQQLEDLTDYAKGTTVNVGMIHGGTASNVVPEHASIEVDFRVTSLQEADRIMNSIEQLKPKNSQAKVTIIGELNRPPLERNAANQKLFELAKHAGKRLNMEVTESSVGGGSDGNYTSALGIPTIDGLGIPGDGPHARHEHIRFDLFVERCTLVAEMCMIYGEQINYQNK